MFPPNSRSLYGRRIVGSNDGGGFSFADGRWETKKWRAASTTLRVKIMVSPLDFTLPQTIIASLG
ncbi:MAG: hypothetical protein ACLQU3_31255 [Limisphaerales bacterium]|jgi:hypothetical protein